MTPVLFVHPFPFAPVSGGHRYNRKMIAYARHYGAPFAPVKVEAAGVVAPIVQDWTGFCLWDSLLMSAWVRMQACSHRMDAWLMHFLPSLDPGLSAPARRAARSIEDHVAETARCFLVTGHRLAEQIHARYPSLEVAVCEPGIDAVFRAHRPVSDPESGRLPQAADALIELVSVANLVESKGYAELLAVLRSLSDQRWRWHIVGSEAVDRCFSHGFRADAAELLDAGRIVMHGALSPVRLAVLLRQTDAFLSCSRFESYGMALAEALAVGLPVVVTDVGDAPRMIAGSANCYCVPVGNGNAFVQAITELLARFRAGYVLPAQATRPFRTWRQAFFDFIGAVSALSRQAPF